MTQNLEVLTHIQKFGPITAVEAYEHYGIMRLAARINELRGEGYEIHTVMQRSSTDTGDKNWAQYHYIGRGDAD